MLTARNATSVRHGVQRLNPESLVNILTTKLLPANAEEINDSVTVWQTGFENVSSARAFTI